MLLSLLFLASCIHQMLAQHPVLFVSPNGTDANNTNCSLQQPCGTLYHASYQRENDELLSKWDIAEIIVNGVNSDQINDYTDLLIYITMPLIITFQEITLVEILDLCDWNRCESKWKYIITGGITAADGKLIINNLIVYDQWWYLARGPLISLDYGTLILNHAKFNRVETGTLDFYITAPNIEIYDTLFSDIYIEWTRDWNWDPTSMHGFIYPINGYIIMKNCTVTLLDFWWTHFVFGYNMNYAVVENCFFHNQIRFDELYALIYFQYGSNNTDGPSVYVNDSSFIDCINVLHLGKGCDLSASLNNIEITTSRLKSNDLVNNAAALIMVSETAQLRMTNINVTYEWIDSINTVCGSDGVWNYYGWDVGNQTHIEVPCEMPYRFISNKGSLVMDNVFITSDVTEYGLNEYRKSFLSNWGESNDSVLSLYPYWDFYSVTNSLMYNDRGKMHMENIFIYGVAIHEQILHNTGFAYISNLQLSRPDFYYSNADLINVKSWMYEVIFNEGMYHAGNNDDVMDINIVVITDSAISGGLVGVYDQHGSTEIHNTVISDVMLAVSAYKSNSFAMELSQLDDIGYFHLGDYYTVLESEYWDNEPFYMYDVQTISIKHNVFDYFPKTNYFSIFTEDNSINTDIEIVNNQFLNPLKSDIFNIDHFEEIAKNAIPHTINNILQNNNTITGHLVNIVGYIKSSVFSRNIFEQDDIIQSSVGTSCLFIDDYNWFETTNTSFHCISGNVFYGNGILLNRGRITSCLHPELPIADDDQCWYEFGTLIDDEDYDINDYFIATDVNQAIIKIFNHSHLILDHAIISTNLSFNNESYYPFNPTQMNGVISFLDVIVNETNNDIDIAFYEDCEIFCAKFYQNALSHIHQLQVNCININISESAELKSMDDIISNLTFIDHLTPTKILLSSATWFYPGGVLPIDFVILDSENNSIPDYRGNINILLSSTDFNFQTAMNIYYDNNLSIYQCDMCQTGLYIQNARMNEAFQNQYAIASSVENNLFAINHLNINVTQCPSGFGLNLISSQCYECSIGEFSIKPSKAPCYNCNDYTLKGVACLGSNKLQISRNVWVGIDDFNVVSQFCPSAYCNEEHAFYIDLHETDKLCATGRDASVPLCGACKPTYSELFGSTNCGKCDGNRYGIWLLFIIIALFLTVFIILISATSSQSDQAKKKTFNSELMQFCSIAFSKPILYFYQSVAFILLNGGISVRLSILAELFNFQLDFAEHANPNQAGFCWIKSLTAKYEIILRLTLPIFCVLILTLIFLMYRCCVNSNRTVFGRQPYFGKAFVKMLLLTIGTICGVCFKLLSCKLIGDNLMVHFYFGADKCYDLIWWISLCVLIFFVLVFCCFFIKLYLDHRKKDNIKILSSDAYILESFSKSYKAQKYWFWEIIMFSRRVSIAMVSVIISDSKNISMMMVTAFLLLQFVCKPFKYEKMNEIEFICLLCLLLILAILNEDIYNDEYAILLINILIIFPFIVFIFQVLKMWCHKRKEHSNAMHQTNTLEIVHSPRYSNESTLECEEKAELEAGFRENSPQLGTQLSTAL